jgi:transposase-like protein
MKRSNTKRYSLEYRLRAVKLKIESGYSLRAIAKELGMTDTKQIRQWIERYKKEGETGLKDRAPKMKEATKQRRTQDRELEELRAENAILKYLLEAKKKDDMKLLKR